MGIINIDFISVAIGYMAGVFLMWAITQTLYGDNNEKGSTEDYKHIGRCVHHGHNSMYNSTPE